MTDNERLEDIIKRLEKLEKIVLRIEKRLT